MENWRLQPWRYLTEVMLGLQKIGHDVSIVSISRVNKLQEAVGREFHGLPLHIVSTDGGRIERKLRETLDQVATERAIWHVGLTSFLHQSFQLTREIPSVGVFTSPVYRLSDVLNAGIGNLILEPGISAMHVLGLTVPGWAIRRTVEPKGLRTLVTLSETTKEALGRKGLSPDSLIVISPGLDRRWQEDVQPSLVKEAREFLGFKENDIILAYAGSPMRLRGIDLLIQSAGRVMKELKNLRLLILSRNPGHYDRSEKRLRGLASHYIPNGFYRFVSGFLTPHEVRTYLTAADIIGLPFQLVPSDVPLSVLEVMALGKPVITTRVGCLPELVPEGCGLRVQPMDMDALSLAIMDLASNPQRRLQMGKNAKKVAREHDTWQRVTRSWEEILVSP